MTEEQLIKSIVSALPRPGEVTAVDYSFSDDSTGVPSVWVNLHVARDNKPSDVKIRKLNAFRNKISESILENDVARWPYVRFVSD